MRSVISEQTGPSSMSTVRRRDAAPARVVAVLLVAASVYGFAADRPYRGLTASTVTAARAQDVCSIVVAVLLLALAAHGSGLAHLTRLGLYGYVAYSYVLYLVGMPMNRAFLVYVVLVAVAGFGLVDGIARLDVKAFRPVGRALERGTGWLLVVVAIGFAGLWLAMLVPFALGGEPPGSRGPGGAAFPVFVLDLCLVLPCLFLVGRLLLRGDPAGGPLAVVALVTIATLFTVLWVGVVAAIVRGDHVQLGLDAGPSTLMVASCYWLLGRWAADLDQVRGATRDVVWPTEQAD